MTQMTQIDTLERLVMETDKSPLVTGVRVFVQYCLRDGRVNPTIICQAMSNSKLVYREPKSYVEVSKQYPPAETKKNPRKVIGISQDIEERALEIADCIKGYHPENPLRVIVYKQDPPYLKEFPKQEGTNGLTRLVLPRDLTIFVQYCLAEDKNAKLSKEDVALNASVFSVHPAIIGPDAGDIENFEAYAPIKTWTSPEVVKGIGDEVEQRAIELAEAARKGGNVKLYLQNPPGILVLNGRYLGDKPKE